MTLYYTCDSLEGVLSLVIYEQIRFFEYSHDRWAYIGVFEGTVGLGVNL